MKVINSAYSITIGKLLEQRNNPDYSEENYTHVIPSCRNLTVQSRRAPAPKAKIAADATYSSAIHDYLNNR